MTEQGIIKLVRYFVHDEAGVIFTDGYLSDLVSKSVVEYCSDTGVYSGKFIMHCDENGFCKVPDDYISIMCSWNSEGIYMTKTSSRYLDGAYGDYTAIKGLPMFVYEDIDTAGGVRLCPNPYDLQEDVVISLSGGYGTANISGYGIPVSDGYGIITGGYQYECVAFSVYSKVEKVENILDYQAILYHCLSDAYLADTDFKSTDLSKFYRNLYMKHVSLIGSCYRSVSTVKRSGRFY